MPKKYQTYKCTVCKRKTDKEFKPAYSFIEKCDITYSCRGVLKQIGEKNSYEVSTSYEEGVENWRPRNQQYFYSTAITDEQYFPLSISSDKKIVVGIDLDFATRSPGLLYEKLKLKVVQVKDKSLTFNDYLFRVTDAKSFGHLVSGNDSNNNTLDFSILSEDIFVFLNGYQMSDTDYELIDSTSSTAAGIQIKVSMPGYSVINVIVKEKSEEVERELTFTSNQKLANLEPNAWSAIKTINCPITLMNGVILNKDFALYTIDNPNELGFDVRLQAKFGDNDNIHVYTGSNSVFKSLSNFPNTVIGLFSERQYESHDRILTSYYKLSDIRGVLGFLKYSKIENTYEWAVAESSISFPPFLINTMLRTTKNGITQEDPIILNSTKNEYYIPLNLESSVIVNS